MKNSNSESVSKKMVNMYVYTRDEIFDKYVESSNQFKKLQGSINTLRSKIEKKLSPEDYKKIEDLLDLMSEKYVNERSLVCYCYYKYGFIDGKADDLYSKVI